MAAQPFPEGRGRALLRAALEVVGERGYAGAGVKEIAERAGMAAGTFYLYFPSKEALGQALIEELYRRTLGRVAAARVGAQGAREKLARSLEAVLATFGEDRALARFVLTLAPGAHPSFDRRLVEVHEALTSLVAEDLVEAGETHRPEAELKARILIGAVGEVVTAWARREASPEELRAALTPEPGP
jgi:TetR/AcrR family fatty acid metabolism transcriptional regulator